MRKFVITLAMILCCAWTVQAQLLPKLGAQRAGISALTFLKIDPSPRAAGLASAHLTLSPDAYSTYWNPAAMADLEHFTIGAANTFWAAGINHAFASGVYTNKGFGNIGVSVTSLTTGKMERRTEFQPNGTGEYFYASNTAIGLSYGKQLTDMFSFGATVKYVNETLAEFQANTAVVDLGFLYKTDFKDLSFAAMLQSFGGNSKLKGSYTPDPINPKPIVLESYPAPTLFKLGISMVPIKTEDKSLFVALQLNHPNDNAENIRIGAEFEYKNLLFLRGGYKINVKDQNFPTAGVGIRARIGRHPLMIDYAVDPTKFLGWMHRVGVSFAFHKAEERESAGAEEGTTIGETEVKPEKKPKEKKTTSADEKEKSDWEKAEEKLKKQEEKRKAKEAKKAAKEGGNDE